MNLTHETPPRRLAALVVKEHLSLGGLSTADQALALAWVWAGLPDDRVLSEPEVNRALQAQLAGAAVWLATDHVELRRWLVDGGWLRRDGYGREYRRTAAAGLSPERHEQAASCDGIDTAAWTAARREAHFTARALRRRQWQAANADPAGLGPGA